MKMGFKEYLACIPCVACEAGRAAQEEEKAWGAKGPSLQPRSPAKASAMSMMHVNLASYNVKQEPASQSGPATGPFAEPPWHERTSSAIVARTSVTEVS